MTLESYFLDASSAAEASKSADQMSHNTETTWLDTRGSRTTALL